MMARHEPLAHNDAGRPPIAFACTASDSSPRSSQPRSADAQQKNSWDSAIDSLAAKIAAIAGAHASVRLNVKNLSSLDAGRVGDFTSALEAQLQQRGLKIENGGAAGESIDVTIAENLRQFIFAAAIEHGDLREIALEALDRAKAEAKSEAPPRVRLQRELIWSQREPLLDFLVIPAASADGARRLFVLEPRRLVVYRSAAEGWQVAGVASAARLSCAARCPRVFRAAAQRFGRSRSGCMFRASAAIYR